MKQSKKILYIDMDGVIADFNGKMKELSPTIDMSDYHACADQVNDIVGRNPHVFASLLVLPGSIEHIKVLDQFYEIYFLSTPMWNIPESYTGKRVWLEQHFGSLAEKKLILTNRKDLNIGDFLIDDTTNNGAGEFKGERIHFGTERYPGWEEVFRYLINVAVGGTEYKRPLQHA